MAPISRKADYSLPSSAGLLVSWGESFCEGIKWAWRCLSADPGSRAGSMVSPNGNAISTALWMLLIALCWQQEVVLNLFCSRGAGCCCDLAPTALLGGGFRHKPHAGAASCTRAEPCSQAAAGAGTADPQAKPAVEARPQRGPTSVAAPG